MVGILESGLANHSPVPPHHLYPLTRPAWLMERGIAIVAVVVEFAEEVLHTSIFFLSAACIQSDKMLCLNIFTTLAAKKASLQFQRDRRGWR